MKEYWNEVFSPVLDSYKSGVETPNPDVLCNRFVKFHHLRRFVSDKLGVQTMATGHYARVSNGVNGGMPQLLKGVDPTKDQSYFLSLLQVSVLHNNVTLWWQASSKQKVHSSL